MLARIVRCKDAILDFAEVFDTLRIVPRLILFGYACWMVRLTAWILKWYFTIPSAERTTQVTAVIGIIVPAVFGLACWVYKIYSQGGRDWDQIPPPANVVNNQVVNK